MAASRSRLLIQAIGVLRSLLRTVDFTYTKSRNAIERAFLFLESALYRPQSLDMALPGYAAFRNRSIVHALDHRKFSSHHLPEGFGVGMDERIVEYAWLLSRKEAWGKRVLDAGSALNFDFLLRRSEFQKLQLFIATLGPEPECHWWRKVSYAYGDLREACFRDGYFDSIVCLSTIEHVGLDTSAYTPDAPPATHRDEDWLTFLGELHRMLKPGGTLFLSFPVGKRKNWGWLQTFDEGSIHQMSQLFSPRMEMQSFFRSTDKGWKPCTLAETAEAGYRLAGSAPNASAAVAAEAIACIEWVK
jgi:SAM-dependent methyltransferase